MAELEALITGNIITFIFVFTRVGAAFMVMPGFGDRVVPTNIRLFVALGFALVITPVVGRYMPDYTLNFGAMFLFILQEVFVGLFIGLMARAMMSAMNTAGMVISFTMSLANAHAFNPQISSQGSVVGVLLTFTALTLIFATNLHHLLILSVVHSYELVSPGNVPGSVVGDMTLGMVEAVNASFLIAIQFSAPFLILSITFKTALGVVARLVPQVQVFFLGIPVQVLGGLLMMMAMLSMGMMFFLDRFEAFIMTMMGMT